MSIVSLVPGFFRRLALARRTAFLLVASALWIVCTGYALLRQSVGHDSFGATVVYQLTLLASYGALWLYVAEVFKAERAAPSKAFWHTLVVGSVCFGLAFLILHSVPGGFDSEGLPVGPLTIAKSALISLCQAVFAFVLLSRFRDLALYRKSRKAERNWRWMLTWMGGLAVLAAFEPLVLATDGPVVLSSLLGILFVPAVVLFAVNALRLSWIVQLSFRRKTIAIGLALLLLAFFVFVSYFGAAGEAGETMRDSYGLRPTESEYVGTHSSGLNVFLMLSLVFGVVYCVTSILSLLFHLPTTGDFQRHADEMAVMHSLTDLVNQVFDLEKLVTTITASPVEAGSATASWLAVADPHTGTLEPRVIATHNVLPSVATDRIDTGAFYREVLSTRRRVLVERAMLDRRVGSASGDGIGSLLVIPLSARNKILGALFVARDVTHGFEREDVEAIGIFAAQAAIALENARLFEQQIERERLSRELAIAREVQHRLLPQRLPSVSGLSVAASSVSAHEVGGDYYDFAALGDDRLALIVGDVSGKGTSAAFYMAELQGMFQSVTRIAPAPQDFLMHANAALSTLLDKKIFISAIYGLLDRKRQELRVARAGHCPAAIASIAGEARYVRPQGLGLGLSGGPLFQHTLEVETIRLSPGDLIVFYTDGVVESRNAAGEEFGYDRLLAATARVRHEDAEVAHETLLGDLKRFIGSDRPYDDDLTLVVLKWHG